ncbi:SPFH domain-containing protein [soil metagenome]
MSIWQKLTGELVDIIQFLDESGDTLVHRFERYNNEIKNGAKLVVREGQAAVFVNEGQIADVFPPGTFTLTTQNLPLLSTLKGWKYGFESPFKAEVYFVSTRQFTDLKWGTMNPIMRRDPEFGPVRLRAFGNYAFRINDPAAFVRQIAGTNGRFTVDGIQDQLRALIVARFADTLGESSIPMLDLAGNQSELGEKIGGIIRPEFTAYGVELTKLLVENISLPPEVEAALDKRSSMGIIGNMQQYGQFQAANAMEQAAKNPGSGAAQGMGMNMGFMMGGQMGGQIGQQMQPGAGGSGHSAPPPLSAGQMYFVGLNGQQAGPFDFQTLTAMTRGGQLTGQSMVWKTGMANWAAASSVAELAGILAGASPPPLK